MRLLCRCPSYRSCLLCISTSFWALKHLKAGRKILRPFFQVWNHWKKFEMNKKGWKRLKNSVLTSFWVGAAPKSRSKYTTHACLFLELSSQIVSFLSWMLHSLIGHPSGLFHFRSSLILLPHLFFLSFFLSVSCLSFCIIICLSVCPPICPSVFLPNFFSVSLSVFLHFYLFSCLYVLFVCLSDCLFLCLSVYLSAYFSLYLFVCFCLYICLFRLDNFYFNIKYFTFKKYIHN